MKQFISVFILAAGAAAGCGANNSGNTTLECAALTKTAANPAPQWAGSVITVVMENKSRGDIFGNSNAPFINQLAKENAVANGYHDPYVHPSEPNYLWMVAGENFGILDDADPLAHSIDATAHIADQLELAGLSWKTYQQSMGEPCGLTSHGRYASKHNPFIYFDDINGWDGKTFQPSQRCIDHVVDYDQLGIDIANNALPKYVFITPDLDHDMHDGSIAQADAWLSTELPKLMATESYKTGGVIFLLWDEGSGTLSPDDDPPFIAISPQANAGMVSKTAFDTSSYLKTVEEMLGLDAMPCAKDPASVHSMAELFSVPLAM
jgi:phosphatidylinositol-3-phosphatase